MQLAVLHSIVSWKLGRNHIHGILRSLERRRRRKKKKERTKAIWVQNKADTPQVFAENLQLPNALYFYCTKQSKGNLLLLTMAGMQTS